MEIIEQGIKAFGNAADLARVAGVTPQAISVAKKRGRVSKNLDAAIRKALRRLDRKVARRG